MTNNFSKIRQYLNFESSDDYYFIQVMIRSKDNHTIGSNNRLIKSYAITSVESFDKYKFEIMELCNTFGARAYIHFTKRSFKAVSLLMLKGLTDRIINDQSAEIKNIFDSASGSYKPKDNTWVVDIDNLDFEKVLDIGIFIDENCKPNGRKIICAITTPNGYHLITKPFDVSMFEIKYPDIGVHKNNPTLLYKP